MTRLFRELGDDTFERVLNAVLLAVAIPFIAWVLIITLVAPALAGEQLDLTTPITTPDTTAWTVDEIHLWWSDARMIVIFKGPNGEKQRCTDSGASATTTMRALNKANLTTNSLQKRAITWAQGLTPTCLGAGSVSGVPN